MTPPTPSYYATRLAFFSTLASRITVGLSCVPVLACLLILTAWLFGRLALGRWPIPIVDDPYSIDPLVSGCCLIARVVCLLANFAFCCTMAFLLAEGGLAAKHADRRRQFYGTLTLAVAAWGGSLMFFIANPFRMAEWFMD